MKPSIHPTKTIAKAFPLHFLKPLNHYKVLTKYYLCPHLLRNRIISSFFLCAFTVLFSHSIVPHHHAEERYTYHQPSNDDDHDDTDHNFLGDAFSHFQHQKGSTAAYETTSSDCQCSKVNVDEHTFLLVQYIVQVLHKPPTKHPEPYPKHFTSSSYSVTTLLRGPPVAVA